MTNQPVVIFPVNVVMFLCLLLFMYSLHKRNNLTVEPRLSGFLDYPDFFSGPNLVMNVSVLVTIKIRSHIPFKTTALKSPVRCEGFCSQRAKAALTSVVTNEEHSSEF